MELRLLIWTFVLALTPTLLCAAWTSGIARHALSTSLAEAAADAGRALAVSVIDRVDADLTHNPTATLEALALDNRVAFAQVIDRDGRVCFDYSNDEHAWTAYELWRMRSGEAATREMGVPIFPTETGDLVVCQLPIWNLPRASRLIPDEPRQPRQLQGSVILAMRDPRMVSTLAHLVGWQLIAAGATCVAMLPAVLLVVRRWVKPLRELLVAASRLGAGERPEMVTTTTRDEVGMLTHTFNHMARSLYAARLRLQRANDLLEQQVEHRTAELQQAKQRLEEEIKDKNEFLRAVSHDLNAPLRNIGGMARMLLLKHRESLTDDVLTKLERISANVKTQSDLLGDLLELSQLRARPSKREAVDLNALIAQIRDNLAFDLERRGITLQIDETLPTLMADRNRMRQVFQNLLDNATKYMGDAPVKRITVACVTEPDFWHFTVADTGPGIAENDQQRIFQVFTRGRQDGRRDVPGRGVGLAGVKTIVECYGGRIWVESEPGKGSCFHFTIRRCKKSDASAPAADETVATSPL